MLDFIGEFVERDRRFADKYFELEELENILEGKNGIILIDELHSLISCYDSPKSKRKLVSISRQIRKRNFNLYITAQVLNDIPAFIRRLAPEIIICKKLHYDLTECFNPECKEEHLFLNKSLEGSMIIFEPHLTLKINSKYVKIKNFFFNIYDTHEIIKFVDIKKRRN